MSTDKKFLEFKLQNGYRYEEKGQVNGVNNDFTRINFKEYNKLKLEIKDNGKGFNTNNNNAFNGNGLKNIKSRAAEVNAMVNIFSKENEGTRILLEINMK